MTGKKLSRRVACAMGAAFLTPAWGVEKSSPRERKGIWISRAELKRLPVTGLAWEQVKRRADQPMTAGVLSDQDQNHNVEVLAKALVYGRTDDPRYRAAVIANCLQVMGTERGGRTLALGRNLAAYVIAADIVGLEPAQDVRFRAWLRAVVQEKLEGQTLIGTHEDRPNNWGTHAGASRAAVAVYLGDDAELRRTAAVFKGYLGDRAAYAGFRFGESSWQVDPEKPVAINRRGAMLDGHSVDGVMPDDMRRGGSFQWPPKRTGYPWEALQGAVVQAEILHRAGFDAWEWEDRAILRSVEFLHKMGWAAEGDDQWVPWLVNHRYGTRFPARSPARPGKNMGWTDWTHGAPNQEKPR